MNQLEPSYADLASVLYRTLDKSEIEEDNKTKECRLCKFRPSAKKSNGYTNLASHVRDKHRTTYLKAYEDLTSGSGAAKPLTDFV